VAVSSRCGDEGRTPRRERTRGGLPRGATGELIEYITAAVDRYRTGEIDAHVVDETIHHYHQAARELWKFCWSSGGGTHIEIIAHLLDRMTTDGETINWWERVTPRQRS